MGGSLYFTAVINLVDDNGEGETKKTRFLSGNKKTALRPGHAELPFYPDSPNTMLGESPLPTEYGQKAIEIIYTIIMILSMVE